MQGTLCLYHTWMNLIGLSSWISHTSRPVCGMFTEIASEAQDDPMAIMQTLGLLGGPTASIISVISTGVDPFTRRPVVNKLDDKTQQVEDSLKYIYNLMMPPFLHTDYGALNRLMQTMDGELNRYGEPMKTIGQEHLTNCWFQRLTCRAWNTTPEECSVHAVRDTEDHGLRKENPA